MGALSSMSQFNDSVTRTIDNYREGQNLATFGSTFGTSALWGKQYREADTKWRKEGHKALEGTFAKWEGVEANKRAEDAENAKMAKELQDRKKGEESNETAVRARDAARAKQRSSSTAYGRRSTILTSPLGVPGEGSGGGKTLLGA